MCDVVTTGKTNGMSVCVFLYFLKHSKVDSLEQSYAQFQRITQFFFFFSVPPLGLSYESLVPLAKSLQLPFHVIKHHCENTNFS